MSKLSYKKLLDTTKSMPQSHTPVPAQPNINARDDYGYPLPLEGRDKLRKLGIRTSKRILGICISLFMNIIGILLWLGRRGKSQPPLKPETFHPQRILIIRLDLIGDLV